MGAWGKTSEWMGRLADNVPLTSICIPGAHNAGTSSLSGPDIVDPWGDLPPGVALAVRALPVVRPVLTRGARTQRLNVSDQLTHGIRYLDLRVAYIRRTHELRCVHAQLGDPLADVLEAVRRFAGAHPGEVVLVDLKHLIFFDSNAHSKLRVLVEDILGELLLSPTTTGIGARNISQLTLQHVRALRRQVLVFFGEDVGGDGLQVDERLGWSRAGVLCGDDTWANTRSRDVLVGHLEAKLATAWGRPSQERRGRFHVAHAVLSPSVRSVIFLADEDLHATLAQRVQAWAAVAGAHGLMSHHRPTFGIVSIDHVGTDAAAVTVDELVNINRVFLKEDVTMDHA